MSPEKLRAAIREGMIRPRKSLGQNFLVDAAVVRRIAGAATLCKSDAVVEIGPGLCAMTHELCGQAGFVTAVEIDRFLLPWILSEMRGVPNFRLLHADASKVGSEELLPDDPCLAVDLKVVSNLPYAMSAQILSRILAWAPAPSLVVVMVQKEVAARMMAIPGDPHYCGLSLETAYGYDASRLFAVPPHCFVPQPGVDSTVIALERRRSPPADVMDRRLFLRVVRAAFSLRRKTVENCLLSAGLAPGGRAEARALLKAAGVAEGARGETLGFAGFAALANAISATGDVSQA